MIFFLSFLQGKPDHSIPAYSFWEYYIKNGIEETKDTWIDEKTIDWAEGLIYQTGSIALEKWRANVWSKTIDFLRKNHVDVFLGYLYPKQIDIGAIREIQKMGIPCINFFCDNVREFLSIPKEFEVFDLNWVPEYKATYLYKNASLKYLNLPMPMWVHPMHRNPNFNENDRVSFIGSKDIQRQLLFENLLALDSSLPLDIYGTEWKDTIFSNSVAPKISLMDMLSNGISFLIKEGFKTTYHKMQQRKMQLNISKTLSKHLKGKPNFSDYIEITKKSLITLGVNRYPSYRYPLMDPNTYSRLRDIEAPMLGACYLTEWTDGLNELYDIGNEIEVYKNTNELHYKITELSNDKVKRKKLKINGQKRALNDLSITETLSRLKNAL